jgi:hypothetical protein
MAIGLAGVTDDRKRRLLEATIDLEGEVAADLSSGLIVALCHSGGPGALDALWQEAAAAAWGARASADRLAHARERGDLDQA